MSPLVSIKATLAVTLSKAGAMLHTRQNTYMKAVQEKAEPKESRGSKGNKKKPNPSE